MKLRELVNATQRFGATVITGCRTSSLLMATCPIECRSAAEDKGKVHLRLLIEADFKPLRYQRQFDDFTLSTRFGAPPLARSDV